MKSTPEELSWWKEKINERLQSGMTIDKWCEKNGVSKSKYLYWNRKLNKIQHPNKIEETAFADVTPILTNNNTTHHIPGSSPEFQVFLNNIKIIVPSNFNPDALMGLMKVLKEL